MKSISLLLLLGLMVTSNWQASALSNLDDQPGKDFFGLDGDGEWSNYFMNPEMYLRKIANHFSLDEDEFIDRFGRQNLEMNHVFRKPFIWSLDTTSGIFKNDGCLKRFYCTIQSYIEKNYDKLTPTTKRSLKRSHVDDYFESCKDESKDIPRCEPKLKSYFLKLKESDAED